MPGCPALRPWAREGGEERGPQACVVPARDLMCPPGRRPPSQTRGPVGPACAPPQPLPTCLSSPGSPFPLSLGMFSSLPRRTRGEEGVAWAHNRCAGAGRRQGLTDGTPCAAGGEEGRGRT